MSVLKSIISTYISFKNYILILEANNILVIIFPYTPSAIIEVMDQIRTVECT